jgi:toxin FitB
VTYLLDTNVLSETRKRQPAGGVAGWIAATPPDRLHVSVLTLRDVETGFEDRVLPVTLSAAAAWGRQQYPQPLPVIDALIAATARVHGMTVGTRNVKDFELAGVQAFNPFAK